MPAGIGLLLLSSCGQSASDKKAIPTDSVTVKNTTGGDSASAIPLGADAKADSYYDKPGIENPPKAVATFIPDGYEVLDTCSGDLNLDTYTDMLVLLHKRDEQDSVDEESGRSAKRRLLVLTGVQSGDTYKLAAQSDSAVYCYACGGMMGDPYQGLVIKNGYFSIELYGGSAERWERTITFKYAAADSTWYLHKDGHISYNVNDEAQKKNAKIYTVKNFGKIPFTTFDVYK